MAKKKSTKRKKTTRDPEVAERNKRIAIGASLVVLAGAVFVSGAMGVAELDRAAASTIVSGTPEVVIRWDTLSDGSVWMPRHEQERLNLAIARAVQGGQALSAEPLKEAVLTLQNSGWVRGVPEARWTSEGQIVLDAAWRVPAAAVRVGSREVIIDWDRYVLPLDYAIGQSNQYYFTNTDAPLPQTGQQWMGTDLQDGITLLRELSKNDLLEQVAGFDLGSGADSGVISIITKRGTRVVWGGGPGRERPGEKNTSVKLDRLRVLYERAGLIDGGVPYVDLRGKDIMIDSNPGG
ncbi:MAG: hypothetical protein CMJ35_05490 [Phycisphaerae bacterium]|nr:hypothetical protein [Phycisphaerae bacterium]